MPSLDPTVASHLDRAGPTAIEDDEDALLASLEDDPTLTKFREQRLQQLHEEVARAKVLRNTDHGTYTEIKEEKQIMDITTSREARLAVVHFYKDGFARCGRMDVELEKLAPLHYDTRFLKISVENAPFLCAKLKIQVLPCVIAFVDGVAVDRVIGFEGLGVTPDSFNTKDLEERLLQCEVLVRGKITGSGTREGQKGQKKSVYEKEDSDEDDWD